MSVIKTESLTLFSDQISQQLNSRSTPFPKFQKKKKKKKNLFSPLY